MKNNSLIGNKPTYYLTIQVMGGILIILGSMAVLSFMDFFLIMARIKEDYIPMAPDTGLIFVLYGIVLLIEGAGKPKPKTRTALIWITGMVSIYTTLKLIQSFLKIDLTLENLLFPAREMLNQFPIHRMSPITGGLFLLIGIAYHFSQSKKPDQQKLRMVNMAGFIIGNAGVIGFLGYLFGTPFLYGGKIIPMAATTCLCFSALGLALVGMAEQESFITKFFNRSTPRGRLMRVVLPLMVSAILIQGLVQVKLISIGITDHAVLAASLTLIFSIITPVFIIRLSKSIYRDTERIEKERNDAQRQLLDEKLRLRTLIDSLPDRIFFKDRDGRFIVANNGVAIHTGFLSPKEIIGKTDFNLYPKELAQQYFQDEQTLMEIGIPLLNHEEPSCDQSGQIGWTETNKIPIRNKSGKVVGLVGVSRDITASKKMVQDLMEAKVSAEQANQLKDYFIANLSHEIRTPLNAIIGFSELLKEEIEEVLPGIAEKYFPIIANSSQRLMRTIDLILSLSRLQTGLFKINPVLMDLDAILNGLVQEFRLLARSKSLELTYENTVGKVVFESDEYCVVHSISNVLDNAIKYTYQGYISVKLYQDNPPSIKLDIQDTGIGIKEEYRQKLFEPFSQEDTSFTRKFEGIGLGLSITKKMLDAIGARIWVASTKEIGTTFTLQFPLKPEASDG